MTRAEKLRLMLAHAAAAKQLRLELEHQAGREHSEEGTRVVWNLPGISAYASETHDHAEVADPDAFFDYLEHRYPTEVERREIREVRNQTWLTGLMEAWAKRGPAPRRESALADEPPGVLDEEGTEIPGLKWVEGGAFKAFTVRPSGELARRLAQAARRYARGEIGLIEVQQATLQVHELDD